MSYLRFMTVLIGILILGGSAHAMSSGVSVSLSASRTKIGLNRTGVDVDWTVTVSGGTDLDGPVLLIRTAPGPQKQYAGFFADTVGGISRSRSVELGQKVDNVLGFYTFVVQYKTDDGVTHTSGSCAIEVVANSAPTANNGSVTTNEDEFVDFMLSATDPENDPLKYYIVTNPAHGTLQQTPHDPANPPYSPFIRYTPTPNYNGPDSFTFKAYDDWLYSNTATVTITINPINDPPSFTAGPTPVTVNEDHYSDTAYDQAWATNISCGPNETGQPLQYILTYKNGDTGLFAGSPVINASTGHLSFRTNLDKYGATTYDVKLNDGELNSATVQLTIAVLAQNDPPVNTSAPFIRETFRVGQILTAYPGEWNDQKDWREPSTITFAYQWQRATDTQGSGIVNTGTGVTYLVTTADAHKYLRIQVTAADTGYPESATAVAYSAWMAIQNTPPDAVDDAYEIDEDTILTISAPGVLTNDTDRDNDPLTITLVGGPGHAAEDGFALNQNGSFSYQPAPNYFGTDGFSYTVNDGYGGTDTANVTMTINSVNDLPIAVDDSVTIVKDSQENPIDVLKNDSDPEGDPITPISVTNGQHGTTTLTGGAITYTPAPGFFGLDTFTYTIADGNEGEATALVSVRVVGVDIIIAGISEEDEETQGGTVVVNDDFDEWNHDAEGLPRDDIQPGYNINTERYEDHINQNDSDLERGEIIVQGPDGASGLLEITYNTSNLKIWRCRPSSDTEFIDASWSEHIVLPYENIQLRFEGIKHSGALLDNVVQVTFKPDDTDKKANDLAKLTNFQACLDVDTFNDSGFLGTHDAGGAGDSVPEDWQEEYPPKGKCIAINDDDDDTDGRIDSECDPLTGTFPPFTDEQFAMMLVVLQPPLDLSKCRLELQSNADPYPPNLRLWTKRRIQARNAASVVDGGDYVPLNTLLTPAQLPMTGNTLILYVEALAPCEGLRGRMVTLIVNCENLPTLTDKILVTPLAMTVRDDSITIDEDAPMTAINVTANDTITPALVGFTPTVMSVSSASHGKTDVASATSVNYTPNPDYFGTDSFTYTVSDGNGESDSAVVYVTVKAINDPPSFTGSGNVDVVNSGEGRVIPGWAKDMTVGNKYEKDDGQELHFIVTTDSLFNAGQPAINAENGDLTFKPNINGYGNPQLTAVLYDDGLGDPEPNDNDSDGVPFTITVVLPVSKSYTMNANTTLTSSLDITNGDINKFTFGIATPATNGQATVTGHTFTYIPKKNWYGYDMFVFKVMDQYHGTALGTIFITVNKVAFGPTTAPDHFNVQKNSENNVMDVLANDSADGAATISVVAVSKAQHGTVGLGIGYVGSSSISSSSTQLDNHTVKYTPDHDYVGSDEFTYVVQDSNGQFAQATVYVMVNGGPNAMDDSVTVEQNSYDNVIDVLANDSSDDATVTSIGTASHGTAELCDGEVYYTPDIAYFGNDAFTYTISDGTGGTDTATVYVTVSVTIPSPIAMDDYVIVQRNSTSNTVAVLENDFDSYSNTLTITDVSAPAHGTAVVDGDVVKYTPLSDYFGEDSFTYTIDNGCGGTTAATVSVLVNAPPDAVDDTFTVLINSQDSPMYVLQNDICSPDADEELTVTAVGPASHGTVTLSDGRVTYTPTPSYFGTDDFTYTISDGNGGYDSATVSVLISSVGNPPTAVDDSITVQQDSIANTVAVLTNDSCSPDVGETLTVTEVGQAAHGWAELDGGQVKYTPDAYYFGPDSFVYYITDGNGGYDSATVYVTVENSQQDPPIALDDYITVQQNSVNVTVDVLWNDIDFDNDPLAVIEVGAASHGTTSLQDGVVSYTLASSYFGDDSFSYTISDGQGGTSSATVWVLVNAAPDAVDDSVLVQQDSGENWLNLVANDTDPNGDWLDIQSASDPAHGTVDIEYGWAIYTPDAGYFGTDTFTYTVSDGNGGTDMATVTVLVNAPPDAVNDSVTLWINSLTTEIAVLANDTCSPDMGETLTVIKIGAAAHGTATLSINGKVFYKPAADYFGTDSFSYRITDGHGGYDTATVSVTAENENRNPVAVDDSVTVFKDTDDKYIDVLLNDYDPDASDTITVTLVGTASHGTTALENGWVKYNPDAAYFGPDSFTYTISDNHGATSSATVFLTVDNNTHPPVAVDDERIVQENSGSNAIDVLANDYDPDPTDTISVVNVGTAEHGTVSLEGGFVRYQPNADYFGHDSFTYTIADGNGTEATATVSVLVNAPPTAVADTATVTINSVDNVIPVLANDSCNPDQGETLTVTAVTAAQHGTAALVNGVVKYTPSASYLGDDEFTYTISDGNGGTATASVSIMVLDDNAPPNAMDDTVVVQEDSADNVIDVLANDTDPEGQTLTITAVGTAAHGTAGLNAGVVEYTPDSGYFGPDSFTYTIEDTVNGTDSATVSVWVTAPLDAADDEFIVQENIIDNVLPVLQNDICDQDAGGTLTVTSVSAASHGTVTLTDGVVKYTPETDYFGEDSFSYWISDGIGGTDGASVQILVNAPPDAVDDSVLVQGDSSQNIIYVLSNDTCSPDQGETLTIVGIGITTHGTVQLGNNVLKYTPDAGFFGVDQFTYTITDGHGGTDTATVSVTVNAPPQGNDDSVQVYMNTDNNVINVLANDTCAPDAGETLTVTNVGTPEYGQITLVDGVVQYTPPVSWTGEDTFTYTINDGNGAIDSATVTVTVVSP